MYMNYMKKDSCNCNYECEEEDMSIYSDICKCVKSCNNKEEDECACGFDEEFSVFPENPMFGQSYVPWQVMDKVYKPEIGLKMGTIFPELVSPYSPNQAQEIMEYIEATNKIGEGCNK